ncbi:MAG: C10 family peptidase [Bacteroidales bacterium]|nr:C10 family peptidase [Bacteroidales bacterium]
MLLPCFSASAERVNENAAAVVGRFFMEQTMKADGINLSTAYVAVDATNPTEALYYVFNINQQQGFVIVSANDIATPILGYSLQGVYNHDDMPPNFEGWMSSIAEAILYGIQNGIEADAQIFSEWRSLLEQDAKYFTQREGERAVNPLITTKWDQGDPYNQQCPTYGGSKCMTGCVATTMAQLMKYHSYPASGTGTTPAYTTATYKISVPAITLGATYQWSSMINIYGGGATQPQKDAVALIMYHCGASVKMDYGTGSSGAYSTDAGNAMTTFFKYDKSMRMQQKTYFSNTQWIDLLKQELDAGRPMYHNGSHPSEGGHAFICDGYNNSNQFHFNWGWSGYGDGYYSVTPLSWFPNNNGVFVGIKPDAGGAQAYQIDILYDNNLASSASSVSPMQTFTVSAPIYNSGYKDATGLQGAVGLYQGNNLIATMGLRNLGNLQAGYYYNNQSFPCQVPAGTPQGNYTIRIITKTSGSDWEIARASYNYKTELPLQVTSQTYTITAQAETGGSITPSGSIQVAEGGNQTFTIKANDGYAISKVLINGVNNPTAVSTGSYTFSNVTANHTIVAGFESVTNTYTITATAGDNGIISPSGKVVIEEGYGKTFIITADEGYVIANVLIDGTSNAGAIANGTYTFTNVKNDHTIEATFTPKTNIKESNISELTVYPNPTSGELIIENGELKIENVDIYDVMGKKIIFNFQLSTFNLTHLPNGIYFIRIQTEDKVITKKVVKR